MDLLGHVPAAGWVGQLYHQQHHLAQQVPVIQHAQQAPRSPEHQIEAKKSRRLQIRVRICTFSAGHWYWTYKWLPWSTHVKENHGANIFGVAFNTLLGKDEPQVFATAGSNRVTVYECPRQGGMQLLHCYADPDVSRQDTEYTFKTLLISWLKLGASYIRHRIQSCRKSGAQSKFLLNHCFC